MQERGVRPQREEEGWPLRDHTRKKRIIGRKNRCDAHLRDDLADFTEVGAATEPRAGEEVLDEARADVVPHPLELLVHLGIILIILDELHDECAVREGEQFCILSLPSGLLACKVESVRVVIRTIFSVRPFQRSSPMALYCLLVVAMIEAVSMGV